MKKSIAGILAAGVAMAMLSGCASVKTAKVFNGQKIDAAGSPVAHINAKNSGFYLLSMPLISGETAEGAVGKVGFGKDTVNIGSVVDVVTRESKTQGGTKTLDLVSHAGSVMIPVPIPFIFYYKSVEVSGNAVK